MQKAWLLASVLLALPSCGQQRIAVALPIPPERMDCEAATGKRPTLPPEYAINWAKIATVGQAKTEFDNFVLTLRGREQTVSTYVLKLEGDLFQCANDDAWLREWNAETR